jgi:hypothetical protein
MKTAPNKSPPHHTIGPWHLNTDLQVLTSDGTLVAWCYQGGKNRDEYRTNSALMASAPELFKALKDTAEQLATWFEMADPEDVNANDKAVLANARAAIAKAKAGAA